MALFVVVGAGPVGRETARLLAAEGHEVRLVSRTGAKPADVGVVGVALDARDSDRVAQISAGAEAIFMCAMAPYNKWSTDFPPIMEGVVTAAKSVGARLVILGNVYGYGEAAEIPLTTTSRLMPTSIKGRVRAAMWDRALAASIPALEVRASDYLGDGAASLFTLMALPPLLAGEAVAIPGDLDALHAWSFTKDVARTLVAASFYSGDWGCAFHAPSQHASIRDVASRFAALASVAPPNLRALTRDDLNALADDNEIMREIVEMAYLYERPCLIDASDTERWLGITASPLDAMISDTLARSDKPDRSVSADASRA